MLPAEARSTVAIATVSQGGGSAAGVRRDGEAMVAAPGHVGAASASLESGRRSAARLSQGVAPVGCFDGFGTSDAGSAGVVDDRGWRLRPVVPRSDAGSRVRSSVRAGTRGFTLIEIMVALVVLSLAALALIRLEGQTIRSTGIVSSTLLAQIVARNVAIEAVTDAQPPVRGRATGIEQAGGKSWTWARDVQPLGDGDVQRIDVAVSDGGGAILGRATMVRPPPAPVQTRIGQSAGTGPGSGASGQDQTRVGP